MTSTTIAQSALDSARAARRLANLSSYVEIASQGKRIGIYVSNKSTWYEDILSGLRLFTKTTDGDTVTFSLDNGGCIEIRYNMPTQTSSIEVL